MEEAEMTALRDDELGAALRALEVPEHGADFDAELERLLATPRARRRARWVPVLAAVVALLVAAGVALFLPRGSEVASAAQLRETVVDAFGSARTITGVFVNREQPRGGENRWRFVVDSSGSFRIAGVDQPTVLAYDSASNVETYSDTGLFVTRTGLAPGPPDADAADWVVERGLGSVVASLATEGDAEVEETEYRGRSAWEVRTPTGNPGEERLITVDRQTGIPVRSALFRNGRAGAEWRVEELRVDEGGTRAGFVQEPKADQQRSRYDMGFRRVRLEEVRERLGRAPVVASWVPAGFERVEVAVAKRSRATGDEQRRNPPSRDVVSIRYRRGLDELVVTSRLTGADPSAWGDPVLGSSPMARRPELVAFAHGALAGREGELVIDANSVPHVWAVAGPLVVTAAGNLDHGELIRVAESLE
jgi:hypothetical protein